MNICCQVADSVIQKVVAEAPTNLQVKFKTAIQTLMSDLFFILSTKD